MNVSKQGLEFIKSFEGCKLSAYLCSAKVPTIGYGHTDGVYLGQTVTREKADELLKSDLVRFEAIVTKLLKLKVSQNQYDALVSFAFNCGEGNLAKSTLLKLVNEGKHREAGAQFLRWDKAAGVVVAGLTRRRQAEKELFESLS